MRLLSIFVILFAFHTASLSQLPGILAVNKYGGSSDELFRYVTQLKKGNYILAGY